MDYVKLISVIEIESVRLIDGQFRTSVSSAEDAGDDLVANIGHSIKLAAPVEEDGRVKFNALFSFGIAPKPIDAKVTPPTELVSIRCTFELAYVLPPGSERPDQATVEKFGDVNALFNAWPYWREFLESSLSRMRLPSFVVPVIRMGPGRPDQADDAKKTTPSAAFQ